MDLFLGLRYYHVESYQLRATILSRGELSVTCNDIIKWRVISYVQRYYHVESYQLRATNTVMQKRDEIS